MSFFSKLKKNPYYLYVSLIFVGLFFVGNYFISNRLNIMVEDFVDFVVEESLRGKHNILKHDFDKLNSFSVEFSKLISASGNESLEKLKEKLVLKAESTVLEDVIDHSFIRIYKKDSILFTAFVDKEKSYINALVDDGLSLTKSVLTDTIVRYRKNNYNRKIVKRLLSDDIEVVVGYDVNLIKYWKFFSEYYLGEGGYSVLINNDGVCLLHPEPKYIGKRLDYFKEVSLQAILAKNSQKNPNYLHLDDLYKTKALSEFLNIEVLRYFSVIETEGAPLVLVTSYPIDIIIKEPVRNITGYFSLVSGLFVVIFLLILAVSRWYLRRQYAETLKYEQERKKLAVSNEQYQQKNAILQLNQLRKKMNPHFLFNTLNSLHALIGMDKKLSQQFVLELSEVYRYLLEDREGNLVTVKEELGFLKQYLFLLEIRFNESLKVVIKDDTTVENQFKKIPFLALETLVENAIKHNEITRKNPLEVVIVFKNELIMVVNNYKPRKNENTNSYKIGLNYLENCYQFYGINTFKAGVENEKFKCILPLLP